MATHTNLPIYKAAYDLLDVVTDLTKNMQRDFKRSIGSERLSKEGYLERKIHDGLPMQSRWRAVHLLVWEAANGPVPAGHAVTFKDGNRRNTTLDNLALISRADLMRRNTVHNYGKEIAELVQLRGAIARSINRKERALHE